MGPLGGRLRHLSGRLPLNPPALDQQQRIPICTKPWMLDLEGEEALGWDDQHGTVNCGPPPCAASALDVAPQSILPGWPRRFRPLGLNY